MSVQRLLELEDGWYTYEPSKAPTNESVQRAQWLVALMEGSEYTADAVALIHGGVEVLIYQHADVYFSVEFHNDGTMRTEGVLDEFTAEILTQTVRMMHV